MNFEIRAAMLRKRVGTTVVGPVKPLGMHRARNPSAPDRREIRWHRLPQKLPPKIYFEWPQIEPNTKRAPEWFMTTEVLEDGLLSAELPSGAAVMQTMAEKWLANAKLVPLSKRVFK